MGCVIVSSKSTKSLLTGYVNSLLLPPYNLLCPLSLMHSTVKLFSYFVSFKSTKTDFLKISEKFATFGYKHDLQPKFFFRLKCSSLYWECETENRFQICTLVKSVPLFFKNVIGLNIL